MQDLSGFKRSDASLSEGLPCAPCPWGTQHARAPAKLLSVPGGDLGRALRTCETAPGRSAAPLRDAPQLMARHAHRLSTADQARTRQAAQHWIGGWERALQGSVEQRLPHHFWATWRRSNNAPPPSCVVSLTTRAQTTADHGPAHELFAPAARFAATAHEAEFFSRRPCSTG